MTDTVSPETLPAQSPVLLHGAMQFDVASKISGRTYRISVMPPLMPPPPAGYPVVVVTDAALTFPIAATMNAAMALNGGQPALVVGVGYPTDDYMAPFFLRNRDLTPPTPLANIRAMPGQPPPSLQNYGGSDEFYRFLVEELRPLIAGAYAVNPADQTLYGHSLGGLFTLGVMFSHPDSFRTFAASSPSIWWNSRSLLEAEAGFAAKVGAGETSPRVLIMIGGLEQQAPPTPPPGMTAEEMLVLLTEARMVDNARELAGRLGEIKGGPGYKVGFQVFDDEDHMSVVPASISRSLVFALRG